MPQATSLRPDTVTPSSLAATKGELVVSALTPDDATTALFFGNLGPGMPWRIVASADSLRQPRAAAAAAGAVVTHLAGASAVIIVRSLLQFDLVAESVEHMRVPRYYFIDDNFIALREETGGVDPLFSAYSVTRVREALSGFERVLAATPALADYFREQRIHHDVVLFPPVLGPRATPAVPPDAHRPFTVGFFGGQHRRDSLLTYVYPALRRLALKRPVRLVTAGLDAAQIAASPGLQVTTLPYERNYTTGLRQMAAQGIDVLVHPGVATEHHRYKNVHVVINAHAIGAVPVVSQEPPYDTIAGAGIAALCAHDIDAWYAALERLADGGQRREMAARLAAYCTANFSGDANRKVVADMLRRHAVPSQKQRWRRATRGASWFALALGRRAFVRGILQSR